uniref:Uncharacterized protein n=1 Tax=Caenorhabditis japonica TaxID=281687 RepID=A0A8R1IKJ0_CAEJA
MMIDLLDSSLFEQLTCKMLLQCTLCKTRRKKDKKSSVALFTLLRGDWGACKQIGRLLHNSSFTYVCDLSSSVSSSSFVVLPLLLLTICSALLPNFFKDEDPKRIQINDLKVRNGRRRGRRRRRKKENVYNGFLATATSNINIWIGKHTILLKL